MSEDLQDEEVSSSSYMHRSCSAETLCFDSETDTDSNNEYSCRICQLTPSPETVQELAVQWFDRNSSVLLVNNIVYLRCRSCLGVFHLSCIGTNLTVDNLRDLCEEDFCCEYCTEPQGK